MHLVSNYTGYMLNAAVTLPLVYTLVVYLVVCCCSSETLWLMLHHTK